MISFYSLFATTVFLSSFLLFQVQPLIGKHILPWHGGSSAVWVTALFFFMVVLALGYLYVLWLSRFSLRKQIGVHALLLGVTTAVLYTNAAAWPSAITPQLTDIQISVADPAIAVFLTLLLTIGLPFMVLSATSSLLQLWYARLKKVDPSPLYSISNIGSLLGLVSYPFVFEPLMSTYVQGGWWVIGMAFYLGLMGGIMYTMWRSNTKTLPTVAAPIATETLTPVPRRQFILWVIVASVPVIGLLTGTVFMTTMLAPIPLLWVGPLFLYLLSFIWSFRAARPVSNTGLYQAITIASTLCVLIITTAGVVPVVVTVLTIHLSLMAIFHWCHEYLYRHRPDHEQLPLFYVALSLGGILGSVLVKISSTFLLVLPIEFILLLAGVTITIANTWRREGVPSFLPRFFSEDTRRTFWLVCAYVIMIVGYGAYMWQADSVGQFRNFYGYKSILEKTMGETEVRILLHGRTNHGFQVIREAEPVIEKVAYYSSTSGIARTFSYLHERSLEPLAVAVAGLGSGSIAAYCRTGDSFFFAEIDPQVVEIARSNFTYLSACENTEVVTADARLVLAAQLEAGQSAAYDLIILDAYADDMMPMHLMNKEALALYRQLLKPDGLLLIHISSRYLNLLPVVAGVGQANDFAVRGLFDREITNPLATASYWTVLAKEPTIFSDEHFADFSVPDQTDLVVWTDTYSAIFPVIKLW